jgi:WD40 repeat protein
VGSLRLWDHGRRLQRRVFRGGRAAGGFVGLALSPDGKTLASGHRDGTVRLWGAAGFQPLRQLRGPAKGGWSWVAYGLAFSPDGKALAAGGGTAAVYVWDVATGRRRFPGPHGHVGTVRSVALSADGKLLATASFDGTARLWDAATGKRLHELRGHQDELYCVALSPDGRTVATGGRDCTVRLWDVVTGRERRKLVTGADGNGQASAVAFSPDGTRLACAQIRAADLKESEEDQTGLTLWQVSTGTKLRHIKGPSNPYSLVFSADGKDVVVAEDEDAHRLSRWQVATGKKARQFNLTDTPWGRVVLSPDGRLAARGYFDGGIQVYDAATGKRQVAFPAPRGHADGVFSPDLRFLATWKGMQREGGGGDQTVRLWEMVSGQEVLRFDVPAPPAVCAAAFAPDGRALFTGMNDSTALVWGLAPAAGEAGQALGPRRLEELWADLGGADAARAYQALWALALAPGQAVPLLEQRLRPAAAAEARRLRRLCAELNSDTYAVRARAYEGLQKAGAAAVPTLRAALAGRPPLEAHRRLEGLLAAEALRRGRALAVLERVGTPRARDALAALAGGRPDDPLTGEARAALERLDRRGRPR